MRFCVNVICDIKKASFRVPINLCGYNDKSFIAVFFDGFCCLNRLK